MLRHPKPTAQTAARALEGKKAANAMRGKLYGLTFSFLVSISPLASAQTFSVDEKVQGGTIKQLQGDEAGLPISALPGAQLMSSKAFFAQYKERDKTPSGLYVLDADFIPPRLPEVLKRDGLKLQKDGTLLSNDNQKETMLVLSPISVAVQLSSEKKSGGLWENLFPPAKAAAPFPLRNVTAMATWRTPSGFCRTVRAQTEADSWGFVGGVPPWLNRPHTRIEGMETRAFIGPSGDTDTCANCDRESSSKSWNAGCFWPAYSVTGLHYAAFKDLPGASGGEETAVRSARTGTLPR